MAEFKVTTVEPGSLRERVIQHIEGKIKPLADEMDGLHAKLNEAIAKDAGGQGAIRKKIKDLNDLGELFRLKQDLAEAHRDKTKLGLVVEHLAKKYGVK